MLIYQSSVKFRCVVNKTVTNRCIHKRYVATSKHWQTHIATDTEAVEGNGADPADETGGVNSSGFTAITVTHLESNNALVRSRICSAIRVSEGGYVPHAQIIEVIVSLAIEAVLAPS